eukprot:NODE_961_length_2881_cov_0.321352.p2 type:complete len:109 gc:universal NODE_961_length_2881_cov_0.321352:677-1003(+)
MSMILVALRLRISQSNFSASSSDLLDNSGKNVCLSIRNLVDVHCKYCDPWGNILQLYSSNSNSLNLYNRCFASFAKMMSELVISIFICAIMGEIEVAGGYYLNLQYSG